MTIAAIYDVPAPAKLNLFLHVIGRRADGYHLLQSVFVLIDWGDTLHVERARRRPAAPPRPRPGAARRRPLPARRARAAGGARHARSAPTSRWTSTCPGAPASAAAAPTPPSTLLALNRLWRLDWPRARLLPLGLAARRRRAVLRRRRQRLRRRHRRAAGARRAARRPVRRRQAGSGAGHRARSSPAPRSPSASPLLESRAFPKQFRASTSSPGGSGKPGLDLPKASGERPPGCGRESLPRCPARGGRPVASLRQQPHDGFGQRGLRTGGKRHDAIGSDAERLARGLVGPDVPLAAAPPARSLGRSQASVDCGRAAKSSR